MKIAVTGATGFVGQHVIAALVKRGIHPTAIIRPSTIVPASFIGLDVAHLDLADPPPKVFDFIGRPDRLIHLAWGGLPHYQSLHHFERELPAQYNFLKTVVQAGLKSLLVTGTCFEYGLVSGQLSENMPCVPANPYAFAKNALREQLEFLKRSAPFDLTWARLFYLYGEGQAKSSIFSQLKDAAEKGEAKFKMSGGEQIRDYLPISTAANLLTQLAIESSDSGIVNLCSGKPKSVRSMVEGWIGENGWTIEPELYAFPYNIYEPFAFWGDDTNLHSKLRVLEDER